MKNELKEIKKVLNSIEKIDNLKDLDDLRVSLLGKKGMITCLSKNMKMLDTSEKKEYGKKINDLKNEATNLVSDKKEFLTQKALEEKLKSETIDITLPGNDISVGSVHPLTRVIEEIEEIFVSMGYDVVSGPEVELDLYNFEKLNLPKNHPARDTQDSFYISAERLLRTQTSAVQARTMDANKEKAPIRVICPGKTYRRDDDDATHSHQFTQIEGLLVDENISLGHLKGTLELMVKKMFGEEREIRLRPNYFPFTEPSLEIDVSCFKCSGHGCNVCKNTGWIEILGAGMVHPNVLKSCGYDPEKFTGFAFGLGPERVAMLKYGISDIRDFYTNDMRFLKNFDQGGNCDESK